MNVGIGEIRDFVGSLAGFQANKGVFVTTSKFPASATEYESRVPQRIVLIDGERLAALMIKHRVGVRSRATIEINRIDEDYFEIVG